MAWELTKFFYLNSQEAVYRALKTRVMPALHESYEDSRLLEDRFDYLGGQRLGLLFAELKDDVPGRSICNSSWTEARVQMSNAVFQVVEEGANPADELDKVQRHIEGIMQRYAAVEAILAGRGKGTDGAAATGSLCLYLALLHPLRGVYALSAGLVDVDH